ncbi:ATP-binding protein [Agaribacterium haliotis]|uniref:ATP-binding protein n=1 Tax=Agaribacterium haliotis TaxID=2013869 RepID=UPI000BB55D6E|nr:ATP-binding protein [Agaribacterium haliotis]
MQRLSITLLLSVVLSSVVMGWLFSHLHSRGPTSDEALFDPHLKVLASVAELVELPAEQLPGAVRARGMELIALEDFPLPPGIKTAFLRGQPLVLEGQDEVQAHIYLSASKQVLALPWPVEKAQPWSPRLGLTLLFYGGLSFAVLLSLWPLIRDLNMLARATQAYGSGQLGIRVPSSSRSYVKQLAAEFNRMADRIERLVNDNKLLSRAVSHDLKTPLARLRFGLEALASSEDAQRREVYAERVNRDLEAMERLIELLLQYARLDEAHLTFKSEDVDLKELLRDLKLEHAADEINIELHIDVHDSVYQGDRAYLRMMLSNLVVNAMAHAKAQVSLSLLGQGGDLLLRVEDDGPGFDEALLQHLCKPFWRGPQSRGHGMGLAIVERIAHWQGLALSFERSASLGGACVCVGFCKSGSRVRGAVD